MLLPSGGTAVPTHLFVIAMDSVGVGWTGILM
jgi:hypothetical protein